MKKLSILTFFRNEENYGAILQALALSSVLSRRKWDVEIISFSSERVKPSIFRRTRSMIWSMIRCVFGTKTRKRRTLAFEQAQAKLSAEIETEEDLYEYLSSRDICIVGSDQVWNPQMFPKGQNPFLLFNVNGPKKVSYAASFGIATLAPEEASTYESALRQFSALSVREDSGARIVQKMDLYASVVLDPTLLLCTEEWCKKESNGHLRVSKPYLLCYVMPGRAEVSTLYQVATSVAKEHNLRIISLGEREYMCFLGKRIDATAGPAEFLEYFHNAEFVVTNSFHGTCFAINYKKEFVSVLGGKKGFNGQDRNSRIVSILEKLNLTQRIVYPDYPQKNVLERIDWINVHKILDIERKRSLKFIEENILRD